LRARTPSGSRAVGTVGSTVMRRSGFITTDYTSAPNGGSRRGSAGLVGISNNAVLLVRMS
jgi:hypothetical protein